ncbi:MAG: hydroxymethylbilane synthase [Acidobacteriota bacterium]
MSRTWRIGTRGSNLALWQAHYVRDRLLEAAPGDQVEVDIIKTSGDRIQDRPLYEIGGKGLFIKEIQVALLDGRIDLAIHSLKDYPVANPPELKIACVPQRHDRRDALILHDGLTKANFPHKARVGTGSLRRRFQAQLLHPDWDMHGLRGNVETRLRKADSDDLDAVILAAAGLKRLGYERRITALFSPDEMVPAVGQGALAIECRKSDTELQDVLSGLEDEKASFEVHAERRFLQGLGGDCTTPVGINAELTGGKVVLRAFLSAYDGSRHIKERLEGEPERSDDLVDELLKRFMDQGGREMMSGQMSG